MRRYESKLSELIECQMDEVFLKPANSKKRSETVDEVVPMIMGYYNAIKELYKLFPELKLMEAESSSPPPDFT